jgi:hypothetical protein
MHRIDDLKFYRDGYISVSPRGILEALRWKASIGGCRNARGVHKPPAECGIVNLHCENGLQVKQFVIRLRHDGRR